MKWVGLVLLILGLVTMGMIVYYFIEYLVSKREKSPTLIEPDLGSARSY